jgi:uncharacterized alkaline shock family protein YloU
MRIYNGFMVFLATVVFIALGVCLILFSLNVVTIDSLVKAHSFKFLIGGIVFALLGITEIIIAVKNLNKMPVVAFSNPLGEVRVAYDALEGYVKSLSKEIHEIKDAKPQVVAGRDGIEIHVRLVVERDVNLPELTAKFQDLVSRYVKDVMGIDSITSIKVYIQRIATRKDRPSQEENFSAEERV